MRTVPIGCCMATLSLRIDISFLRSGPITWLGHVGEIWASGLIHPAASHSPSLALSARALNQSSYARQRAHSIHPIGSRIVAESMKRIVFSRFCPQKLHEKSRSIPVFTRLQSEYIQVGRRGLEVSRLGVNLLICRQSRFF